MKKLFSRKVLDLLMIRNAQQALGENDLQSLQRLNFFRTFTLTVFLIGNSLLYQILLIFGKIDFVSGSIFVLTALIVLNYFLLDKHRNFRLAYSIIIIASLLVLHIVSYYSGGIRNSGMMYLGGLILTTFMLLGNREGKIISAAIVLNLIYFYFITDSNGYVRNILDTDREGHMLNLDYLISYTAGILLIYSLSNNLESSKNIVISNVVKSKIILEKQNEELKKLSLVASNTDNAVIITDQYGTAEWVNEGFTRLMGYSLEEMEGEKISLLYGPMTDQQTIESLVKSMEEKLSFSGEVQKAHKDGHPIWVQATLTPILDEKHRISKFILVENDISERKKAEEKMAVYYNNLEKANKELDKFAYVVSHDLKAPLRGINNLTVWIEEDIGEQLTDDTKAHFHMLKGRVERMEALINGILDYSRADKIKSPVTEVNVLTLIHEIFEMLVHNEKVNIKFSDNLPVVSAERMKLQQVFSNLISNAIKHNDKPNTVIRFSCVEEKDYYVFGVEDNGPGIEEKYFEKIFIIFQTLQARDTFESTGVGLAIVKKIIDEAGGKIWIESEVGEYTRFMFKWPKKINEK